ncbi:MAG: AIR synthase related protein [Rickettsiales bacterium]|nr:AIR synthase related protein [Rickettsiales bacterium]
MGIALSTLLQCPDIASKRWIYEQYDHMVMNDTVKRPGSDAAVVRVHGTQKALAISTDVTPRYCKADPVLGGMQAVVETYRNISASGAEPLAITNCLNFGNPEKEDVMGQIVGCITGISEACKTLNYPVISGNVSLYNETNGKAISPTPTIGGVGLMKDASNVLGSSFSQEGLAVYVIGQTNGHVGASLYLREVEGREEGAPPPVDLMTERKHAHFIRSMNELKLLSACHDISDGGLLVALAEMCMEHEIGAQLHFPIGIDHPLAYAFGEDQARYVIAVEDSKKDDVLLSANRLDIPITDLGHTGGDMLIIENFTRAPVDHLKMIHRDWLKNYMDAA